MAMLRARTAMLIEDGDSCDEDDYEEESEEEEAPPRKRKPLPEQLQVSHRFRSPTLLLWGGVFGIMGFVLAFVIGLINFTQLRFDANGDPFPSGTGYWPSTVSEMVHDWNSAQGRIFFGFCLISAFMIFQSWYPYELRNVFTGHDALEVCGFRSYWITFRQLVPTVGLLLLICVSTVPEQVATAPDQFSVLVHLIGAFMMFVGYIIAEMKCLAMCGFSADIENVYLDIEGMEFCLRRFLMGIILVSFIAFCLFQAIIVLAPTDSTICCHDEYRARSRLTTPSPSAVLNVLTTASPGAVLNATTSHEISERALVLYNTASGPFLYVKVASFMSEVIAGLALIGSHIVIWYYCEERHVEYGVEHLRAVYDEEEQKEIAGWDGNAAPASLS